MQETNFGVDEQFGKSVNSPSAAWDSSDGGPLGVPAPSVLSTASGSEEIRFKPLLKASPPMPHGKTVGRYRIRFWRPTPRQPFGINFTIHGRAIRISEDLPHLGIRQDDELVSVNNMPTLHLDECRRMLAEGTSVDLVLQHREVIEEVIPNQQEDSCVLNPFEFLFKRKDERPNAGRRNCGCDGDAESRSDFPLQPLRVLLATTMPNTLSAETAEEVGVVFEITVQRTSLKQRFGINFSVQPQVPKLSEEVTPFITISEDVYPISLRQGDQVLSVNGIPYTRPADVQRALERATTVTFRIRRGTPDYADSQVTLPADIQCAGDDMELMEIMVPGYGRDRCGALCA